MRIVPASADPDDMDTEAAPTRPPQSRGLMLSFLLGACIVLTTVTGFVVGWFAIYFQFFGESADSDDYAVAAGAYAAAATVLLLGAVAAWVHRSPRWMLWFAVVAAVPLTLLAVSAVSRGASADPGFGSNHWWDGAGGVIACPWTWPLVVLGVVGVFRGRRRDDVSG